MTTMMDEVLVFLRARLDEDERAAQFAKEAGAKRTHYRASLVQKADRELREVAAKRQQLAHYERVAAHAEKRPDYALAAGACATSIRHMATAYSDHPDYRSEWTP